MTAGIFRLSNGMYSIIYNVLIIIHSKLKEPPLIILLMKLISTVDDAAVYAYPEIYSAVNTVEPIY